MASLHDDLSCLTTPLTKLCQEVGLSLLGMQSNCQKSVLKADQTPLTQADLLAHQRISQVLPQLISMPVISEESNIQELTQLKPGSTFWLIDPLDGTKEYIDQSPEFTINIAIIHQHQPIFGFVFCPATQEAFHAASPPYGPGLSYLSLPSAQPMPIQVRRWFGVSSQIRIGTSRRHEQGQLARLHTSLQQQQIQAEFISLGSSLKICHVASGKIDCYPRKGPTSEWDTAAADCILRNAGGQIVTPKGQPLTYQKSSGVLNPSFYAIGDPSAPWMHWLTSYF